MAYYAIAIVPPDWEADQALGFTQEGYERWHDTVEAGTLILLYKPDPVNAIVAQAEAHGKIFLKPEEWSQPDLKTGMGKPAAYAMPLRVLYRWSEESYIPLAIIQETLDNKPFPADEWLPIASTEYENLRNWSPNLKTTL